MWTAVTTVFHSDVQLTQTNFSTMDSSQSSVELNVDAIEVKGNERG